MITTLNPLEFKLIIVWGLEAKKRFSAEFHNCDWVPRVGELLRLPLEESDNLQKCKHWHNFKVEHLIYSFEGQFTKAVCKTTDFADLMENLPKAKNPNFMKAFEEMEAKLLAEKEQREREEEAKKIAAEEARTFPEMCVCFAPGAPELEEDVDASSDIIDELEELRRSLAPAKENQVVDDELAHLRQQLDEMT